VIRANAVAPGAIRRPEGFAQEIVDWSVSQQLVKSRIGEPNDIASLGALLLSDEGGFITGQTIVVDGGMTTRP
jgi:NAD(P)-dependent dehydrogenase (short-subunit alcohol dehydrogenase family)